MLFASQVFYVYVCVAPRQEDAVAQDLFHVQNEVLVHALRTTLARFGLTPKFVVDMNRGTPWINLISNTFRYEPQICFIFDVQVYATD